MKLGFSLKGELHVHHEFQSFGKYSRNGLKCISNVQIREITTMVVAIIKTTGEMKEDRGVGEENLQTIGISNVVEVEIKDLNKTNEMMGGQDEARVVTGTSPGDTACDIDTNV